MPKNFVGGGPFGILKDIGFLKSTYTKVYIPTILSEIISHSAEKFRRGTLRYAEKNWVLDKKSIYQRGSITIFVKKFLSHSTKKFRTFVCLSHAIAFDKYHDLRKKIFPSNSAEKFRWGTLQYEEKLGFG